MISISGVNKSFVLGDSVVHALNDVNLTIEGGETVAIVGPNGCGKTTLANLFPRFFDPIQGSVRIDDVDLRDGRVLRPREPVGIRSRSGNGAISTGHVPRPCGNRHTR